jgi:hypothetical protein
MQSRSMKTDQAAEHLQTIRTLMERSALYRRALAPVMLLVGLLGILAATFGFITHIHADLAFIGLWFATSLLALSGSFLLIRKQALKNAEPFWTPPTRRVAEAIAPPLFFGAIISLVFLGPAGDHDQAAVFLPATWMALYGCALHSAGFFIPRGIKWLGWCFVLCGTGLFILPFADIAVFGWWDNAGNLAMGSTFGALHLAYGIYLYLTEQRKNVA